MDLHPPLMQQIHRFQHGQASGGRLPQRWCTDCWGPNFRSVDIFRHHLFGLVKGKGLCQTFVIYFWGEDWGKQKKQEFPGTPAQTWGKNDRTWCRMMPHRCDSPCSFQVLRMAEETVGGLSDWQRSFCTPEVPKGWSARVRAVRGWIKIRERNSTDSTHSRRWMPLEETMCPSQKPNLTPGGFFTST